MVKGCRPGEGVLMRWDRDREECWGKPGARTGLRARNKEAERSRARLPVEQADGPTETENGATEWARSEAWQPSPVGFLGKQMLLWGAAADGPEHVLPC